MGTLNSSQKRPAKEKPFVAGLLPLPGFATVALPEMKLRKAVITAAGKNQRTLPLQSLVDRDGVTKTALGIIIEEALAAGVEEIAVVICPGDQAAYTAAAGGHAARLRFIEQAQPLGYGHAVWCAREFTGDAPFLLLVGDHLYVSTQAAGCARQLVEVASAGDCAVSAVQATHESKLPYYGAVGGKLVPAQAGLHEISDVLEKPTPTEAEQKLVVPGLRAGHYLCFFGMHVLTPTVMGLLDALVAGNAGRGGVHLSAALAQLARRERYLAFEARGRRYDLGAKYGLLTAQLALALEGGDRDEVLSGMVELLAQRAR
jgi:UTP--glucose-1-phosphate uridylyltransferase